MRKQYHFRRSGSDVLIWDCDRLAALTAHLPSEAIPLRSIRELDEAYWRDDADPHLTCREIAGHMRLVREADPAYPVILSSDGRLMDGMHRVLKALLEGMDEIPAVRLVEDPEPDYVNVPASDLPYS